MAGMILPYKRGRQRGWRKPANSGYIEKDDAPKREHYLTERFATSFDLLLNESLNSGSVVWEGTAEDVTLDGSNRVSAMADQTGNGRHVTQTTAADRPYYDNSTKAWPYIIADGTALCDLVWAAGFNASAVGTMYLFGYNNEVGATRVNIACSQSSGDPLGAFSWNSGTAQRARTQANSDFAIETENGYQSWYVYQFDWNDTTEVMGVRLSSSSGLGTRATKTHTTSFGVGTWRALLWGATATVNTKGSIAQIAIVNAVDATNDQIAYDFFDNKFTLDA